jgi:hypothetical protein
MCLTSSDAADISRVCIAVSVNSIGSTSGLYPTVSGVVQRLACSRNVRAKDAREHGQSREICRESETPVLALHCRNQSQRSAGQESATNDLIAIVMVELFESAIKIAIPAIEASRI